MTTFLSQDVLRSLASVPPRPVRARGLSVRAGLRSWPVLRMTRRGFVMDGDAPLLPGRVDLYDGDTHLMQGLAVRGEASDGEVAYEFKWCAEPRATAPRDFAPDLDGDRDRVPTIALLAG